MNARALFLFGALLASPVWAQQPSFDLNSDYIKKIVRDTAASQSVPVQLSDEKPAKSEPVATVKYVPPEKPLPPAKSAAHRPVAAPQSNSFLSAVIDILVDEALGIDDDIESDVQSDRSLRCPSAEPLKTTEPGSSTCPGVP